MSGIVIVGLNPVSLSNTRAASLNVSRAVGSVLLAFSSAWRRCASVERTAPLVPLKRST